jgi:hypothetical protein
MSLEIIPARETPTLWIFDFDLLHERCIAFFMNVIAWRYKILHVSSSSADSITINALDQSFAMVTNDAGDNRILLKLYDDHVFRAYQLGVWGSTVAALLSEPLS